MTIANFVDWFRESQAVDEFGHPLILYHGTDADFDVFAEAGKRHSRMLGSGFYFTTSYEQAASYGKRVITAHLKLMNPRDSRKGLLCADAPEFDGVVAEGTPGTPVGELVFVVKDASQIFIVDSDYRPEKKPIAASGKANGRIKSDTNTYWTLDRF